MTVVITQPAPPAFLDAVVDDLNALLVFHGRETIDRMPEGSPQSPSRCPVARALGASVVSPVFYMMDGDVRWGVPARIAKFIRDFDAGLYPELIQR